MLNDEGKKTRSTFFLFLLPSSFRVRYSIFNSHRTRSMRLGLLGGTFDPVHFGHLLLAEQCREQCGLDAVWFLPAGSPPHKRRDVTPGRQRLEMLQLAIAGHEAFAVSDRELKREGTSYTVDTLTELHAEQPDAELFFLIGADSLHDLPTWREPKRILELATIVAVNRGDRLNVAEAASFCTDAGSVGHEATSRIQFATMPGCDLSATDIRDRVAAGKSIRYMTPRAVEVYIQQHGLYRSSPAV
jgi:nicotinate-nucleotide adenylyltransferase